MRLAPRADEFFQLHDCLRRAADRRDELWDRLRSDHCLGPNGILAEIVAEGTDEPIIAIESTAPAAFARICR